MDIEVNEYVRTPIGIFIISHINIDFDDNDKNKCLLCQNEKVLFLSIETIKSLKHSKQLIDLIEVGDIINSCIVVGFGYECVNGNKEKSILVEGKYTKVNFALLNWDIETILTKEIYMANCYKVGGEDEQI